eukprot:1474329-Rhodomonas_salina.1
MSGPGLKIYIKRIITSGPLTPPDLGTRYYCYPGTGATCSPDFRIFRTALCGFGCMIPTWTGPLWVDLAARLGGEKVHCIHGVLARPMPGSNQTTVTFQVPGSGKKKHSCTVAFLFISNR